MTKILVTGLSGSGKTTFCKKLVATRPLTFVHLNADEIRECLDDWDFSYEGRRKQARRMNALAAYFIDPVCDFICPTNEFRKILNPDITVWMDTIDQSKYPDTDRIFEEPSKYDYRISYYDQEDEVIETISSVCWSAQNW